MSEEPTGTGGTGAEHASDIPAEYSPHAQVRSSVAANAIEHPLETAVLAGGVGIVPKGLALAGRAIGAAARGAKEAAESPAVRRLAAPQPGSAETGFASGGLVPERPVPPVRELEISVSGGAYGEDTAKATGLVVPKRPTDEQVIALHRERLENLGYNAQRQTLEAFEREFGQHKVTPLREGGWQGAKEFNARVELPKNTPPETLEEAAAWLGRKLLQDSVGTRRPNPQGGTLMYSVPLEIARKLGLEFDQSTRGDRGLFFDYDGKGEEFLNRLIAAVVSAGHKPSAIRPAVVDSGLIGARDYGRILGGATGGVRASSEGLRTGAATGSGRPVLPARSDDHIRAAVEAILRRGGTAADDFYERLDEFHGLGGSPQLRSASSGAALGGAAPSLETDDEGNLVARDVPLEERARNAALGMAAGRRSSMAPLSPEEHKALDESDRSLAIREDESFYRQGPTIVFNPPWRRSPRGAAESPPTATSAEGTPADEPADN